MQTTCGTPYGQPDLERFQPSCWDDILANGQLKEYWQDLIHGVRRQEKRSGFNSLVTGPSREGKTSTIQFGVKCLLCWNLDFESYNPCHECPSCTMSQHIYGNDGWEDFANWHSDDEFPNAVRFQYMPLDCSRLNESEIESCLSKLRTGTDTLQIVYLDEVHRLARRGMDERFLKPMETFPAIWIASSALVKQDKNSNNSPLEKMFQNRFSYRLQTEKPTVPEMTKWLAVRCKQFGIRLEPGAAQSTLQLLTERSNRSPGMALHVLNKANNKRIKLLTRELVQQHVFDLDD